MLVLFADVVVEEIVVEVEENVNGGGVVFWSLEIIEVGEDCRAA